MSKDSRKDLILDKLKASSFPLSGSALAREFGVSRQVIVQDMALLRAEGNKIISTNQGYMCSMQYPTKVARVYKVSHTTDQIEDELCSIVDMGGYVVNVIVNHPVYGDIVANLDVGSRADVYNFVKKIGDNSGSPLKDITNDTHSHTVLADSEDILDNIEKVLIEKKYIKDTIL